METIQIELKNLGKRFNRQWIFRKLDYSFSSGNAYAITGFNGSGKSTLLQIVAGAMEKSEGELFYKNEKALSMALHTIDSMLKGGIYDQIGGGIARYSTDYKWLAPHFEKMLYDNALFLECLCEAFKITKEKLSEALIESSILKEFDSSYSRFSKGLHTPLLLLKIRP
jgi:uncharacterized protein YyaL (SSP411 family)